MGAGHRGLGCGALRVRHWAHCVGHWGRKWRSPRDKGAGRRCPGEVRKGGLPSHKGGRGQAGRVAGSVGWGCAASGASAGAMEAGRSVVSQKERRGREERPRDERALWLEKRRSLSGSEWSLSPWPLSEFRGLTRPFPLSRCLGEWVACQGSAAWPCSPGPSPLQVPPLISDTSEPTLSRTWHKWERQQPLAWVTPVLAQRCR